MLADLLEIIACDSGPSDDDFVAWKTLDEVAVHLGVRHGKNVRTHAVEQDIHRLMEALLNAGPRNPFLVERAPRLGVRLRLRRKQARVIEGDPE
jgi:hypothetical protein